MKRRKWRSIALLTFVIGLVLSVEEGPLAAKARRALAREVPVFQVDPSWPKIPNNFILGDIATVTVDSQDHIWILHRPRTVRPAQKSMAAPPVVEFDVAGNVIKAWGGAGDGYEWPVEEHGIFVDYKGNVWIGGADRSDNQILKFTQDGKFITQIGHSGQSKGNKDTSNLNRPADEFLYPKTNELFVADGYGNTRVIVFDASTGAFKRMWGAFGNVPVDPVPLPAGQQPAREPEEGPGFPQFDTVHSAKISNDGLVYVSDKGNRRIQVFTIEGKFLKQVFISRPETRHSGRTTQGTAFSPDPQQRFLYVADRSGHVRVLDRKTLEILYSFGNLGDAPGDFNAIHSIAADKEGNIYTTEVNDNFAEGECCRRIQKFLFKGMSSTPRN